MAVIRLPLEAGITTDGRRPSALRTIAVVIVHHVDRADDPRVADYRDLTDPVRRRGDVFVAESRAIVSRLLTRSRFRAASVLVTETALTHLADVLARLDEPPVVYVATLDVMRQIAGFHVHRGCLAVAARGPDLALDAVTMPRGPRALLLLDEVANPDNVGGLFRVAQAFGVDAVVLSPGSADPLYRKSIRVSAGAALSVPFVRSDSWPTALDEIRRAGYTVVALTPDTASTIDALRDGPARVALVVGAEGAGIRELTRAAADLSIRVPMATGVDSLNVVVAAGIGLHRLRGPWIARPP